MKFVFTGKYTNGATGVSILGHRFEGREPTDVTGEAAVRLSRHPEFEIVADEFIAEPKPQLESVSKPRGRPRRATSWVPGQ